MKVPSKYIDTQIDGRPWGSGTRSSVLTKLNLLIDCVEELRQNYEMLVNDMKKNNIGIFEDVQKVRTRVGTLEEKTASMQSSVDYSSVSLMV